MIAECVVPQPISLRFSALITERWGPGVQAVGCHLLSARFCSHQIILLCGTDTTCQRPKLALHYFAIVGDFNAHSTLWGCTKVDRRGKIIEDLITKSNLCILNSASTTYVHPATGSVSAIDLSMCSPDIFLDTHIGNS